MPRSIPATLRRHPLAEAIARACRPLLTGSLLLCLAAPAFGAPVEIELSALAAGDGSQGFVLNGSGISDYSGYSVSAAGDLNGDGIHDVIIGAWGGDHGSRGGQSYVVFGRRTGFTPALELSSLESANGGDGSVGFVLNGADGDLTSWSINTAGDVNGDTIDDVIIGAPYADPGGRNRAGESYVVFGSSTGFSAELELSVLKSASGGNGTKRLCSQWCRHL